MPLLFFPGPTSCVRGPPAYSAIHLAASFEPRRMFWLARRRSRVPHRWSRSTFSGLAVSADARAHLLRIFCERIRWRCIFCIFCHSTHLPHERFCRTGMCCCFAFLLVFGLLLAATRCVVGRRAMVMRVSSTWRGLSTVCVWLVGVCIGWCV